MDKIPFNKPFIIGKEISYINQAVEKGHLAGDGYFTDKCHDWMKKHLHAKEVLLTHSCTAALEMAAILADIQPGDEVIMPSYTFVSTANAFALRGAVPVWCDIRPDTLNIDESKIEELVTDKTKAIIPVHYAGVGCAMDEIMAIADRHNLLVIEDAAQGVNAKYKNQYLGTIGHLGAYSFHETKNYISGEGGALLVNDTRFIERAEIIRQKGTNRNQFFRGEVDKYTWVDIGSSFLPSELVAAFLYAQLEEADKINRKRLQIWNRYREAFLPLVEEQLLEIPYIPENCSHNAHMFYILLNTPEERTCLMDFLAANGIKAVFHYIPLHSSPMGQKLQTEKVRLPVTDSIASRILRLPCYYELDEPNQRRVIKLVTETLQNK
jgi:dTDP-4-amino-4,6-dideoxygalactose transaminase